MFGVSNLPLPVMHNFWSHKWLQHVLPPELASLNPWRRGPYDSRLIILFAVKLCKPCLHVPPSLCLHNGALRSDSGIQRGVPGCCASLFYYAENPREWREWKFSYWSAIPIPNRKSIRTSWDQPLIDPDSRIPPFAPDARVAVEGTGLSQVLAVSRRRWSWSLRTDVCRRLSGDTEA